MRIGELAVAAGLSRDTLRFYEQRGLLSPARGSNGYRCYSAATLELLGYIRTAQRLGFSLAEISQNLAVIRDCVGPSEEVVGLLEQKLSVVEGRISELQKIRSELLEQIAGERSAITAAQLPEQ
jgi:MerR family copper efflux transcriptional regulator